MLVHLHAKHWRCSKGISSVIPTPDASPRYIFCGVDNPLLAHLNAHEFDSCSERPVHERTLRRKDHLGQHLLTSHGCSKPTESATELWKVEQRNVKSRCGVFDVPFQIWDEKAAHLAVRFREGADMAEWAGD